MINFAAIIEKFDKKGEKSGWTYVHIPFELANELNPGQKKAFRVKGSIDGHPFEGTSLWPMGKGNFILPLNAGIRKAIRKAIGSEVQICIETDTEQPSLSNDLLECLSDEPSALQFFHSLPPSHQRYFSNWIQSAKTDTTKAKRILQAINALSMNLGFSEMIRINKKSNE